MAWVPVELGFSVNAVEGQVKSIGLILLSDLYANRVDTIGASKVVRLPGNGSLGTRFTEFDTHAIFGADPFDWRFLIAPDVVNNVVKVSHDGGQSWGTDLALTAQVLKGGQLNIWGGKPDLMEVSEIAFDPYQKGRILVGTRDAGIICSPNRGKTWRTILDLPKINYITGFHFRPDGGVYISSYGHGALVSQGSDGLSQSGRPAVGQEAAARSCGRHVRRARARSRRARCCHARARHGCRDPGFGSGNRHDDHR